MGLKLVNCCRPEQRHQRIWQNDEKNSNSRGRKRQMWRIEEEKKRITRKQYQRRLTKFEMEGLVAQKGLWNMAKEKTMKERGELPNVEDDAVREYIAMHEENFWSNWLREDEKREEPRRKKEKGEKRKREEEKEDNETGTVERRCEVLFL